MYAHLRGTSLQRTSYNGASAAQPRDGASGLLQLNDLSGILTQLHVRAPMRRDLRSIGNRPGLVSPRGQMNFAFICDADACAARDDTPSASIPGVRRHIALAISHAACLPVACVRPSPSRTRAVEDGESARTDPPPPYRGSTPPPPYTATDTACTTIATRVNARNDGFAQQYDTTWDPMPSILPTAPPREGLLRSPVYALERLLVTVFGNTARSVHAFQRFYRPEFEYGLTRAPDVDVAFEGTSLRGVFERQFAALESASARGTRARVVRDVFSLVASSAMLTGVALQIASDADSRGVWHLDAYRHANQPFGDVRASWGMTCLEILKGLGTSLLSYLTMPSHHLTDEYLQRYEITMAFLTASMTDLDADLGAVLTRAGQPRAASRTAHVASELGRHLATVFTLINYGLAPARLALFSTERALSAAEHRCPEWFYPVMGLLRVASSVSDTVRAMLSQLGTHGRQAEFGHRMQTLRQQAALLDLVAQRLSSYPNYGARVRDALQHAAKTCTLVDNDVMSRLAHSHPMRNVLSDLLEADGAGRSCVRRDTPHALHAMEACEGCDANRLARLAPQALAAWGVEVGVTAAAGTPAQRYRLQMRYPEDHWGIGPEGAVRPATLLRVLYRLSLSFQALGVRAATRFVSRWVGRRETAASARAARTPRGRHEA